MKISILLPYKENFSPNYAGAVSLFVKDITKISKYKKNIYIYGNTKFKKTPSKLWTITYANRSKAQLGYIIINKKWKNSAMNCQAYNSFEGVYSDHRIVTSKFRLSLRANKKTSSKFPPYNWSALATNAELNP